MLWGWNIAHIENVNNMRLNPISCIQLLYILALDKVYAGAVWHSAKGRLGEVASIVGAGAHGWYSIPKSIETAFAMFSWYYIVVFFLYIFSENFRQKVETMNTFRANNKRHITIYKYIIENYYCINVCTTVLYI